MLPDDPDAVSRKKDHIELAFRSRIASGTLDPRFYYEPMLSAHPQGPAPTLDFLGKTLRAPLWVSSMTGGTALAAIINRNLARACAEFGMGMGLGSCRQLLYSDEYFSDFDVREIIGPDQPLYANLGIAQLEKLLADGETARITDLIGKLRADGLIVHVNPLQEAMQPGGDVFAFAPVDTIGRLLEKLDCPIIVKEVGQGFGPASMKALLQMPLAALEFAAAGGTNFAKLELLRSEPEKQAIFEKIAAVGHSAVQMLQWANALKAELGDRCRVQELIASGGVGDFLDGYYLIRQSAFRTVYGQASGFLLHAQGDYAALRDYVTAQLYGLELARALLIPKDTF